MKREKKGSRRAYSPEFREEALRLVASGTASIAALARELGVHVETLRLWRRQAGAQGQEPAGAASLEDENRRLRRENARLREERAILKKGSSGNFGIGG
jgi:transposase